MGWDWNPINAGKNLISTVDDVKDNVVDTTVDATDNVVDFADNTKDFAANSFKLQGSIVRAGLEKTADFGKDKAGDVKNFTVDKAGDVKDFSVDKFKDARNFTVDKAGDAKDFTVDKYKDVRNFIGGIDTTPGASNPRAAQGLEFSETKGASKLAYDAKLGEVYKFPNGKEWKVVDVQENEGVFENGFRAIALQSGDKVIVAFAGTDPKSPGDIANDIAQGVGFAPSQYKQAVAFAQKWENKAGNANVKLTGHSLGGGLAAYASIKTGVKATTVNSAPLALTNIGGNPFSDKVRNNPNITNYYVPGEILTVIDSQNRLDMRPGNGIAVEGENSILNPLSIGKNHSIGSVAPDIKMPEKVN